MGPFRGIATARQIQSLLAMTYWYNHYKQLFPLRPPKLVHLKSASKLQTVRQLHQGWRGVANKGTSPRACGWEEYLPLNYNRRSGARHQPLPYWQFLGRTPYIIPLLRRPFSSGCTPRAFGALFTRFPFGVARCLKITTLTRVQAFVGSMLSVKS